MQCACAILSLWPAWLFNILLHDFINGTIVDRNVTEHKMCVLIICTILSETFLILWRNERDVIRNVYFLQVKYQLFLSDFNETWTFPRDIRKLLKNKISQKSVQWEPSCSVRTDRRTGMTKLIVAFYNFAKASKNRYMFRMRGAIHRMSVWKFK